MVASCFYETEQVWLAKFVRFQIMRINGFGLRYRKQAIRLFV